MCFSRFISLPFTAVDACCLLTCIWLSLSLYYSLLTLHTPTHMSIPHPSDTHTHTQATNMIQPSSPPSAACTVSLSHTLSLTHKCTYTHTVSSPYTATLSHLLSHTHCLPHTGAGLQSPVCDFRRFVLLEELNLSK